MGCYYVWGWGAGTDGQIGNGTVEDHHTPQPLLPFVLPFPSPLAVSHLACGGAHTVALTRGGKVLTWGRGTHGQLGHGHLQNCCSPKVVENLKVFVVSAAAAGWNHSAFITDNGRLLTCGDGSLGQLGHGDNQSHSSPIEVSFLSSKHFVKQVACGTRHSLVLTEGPLGNSVYSFGSGRQGQLGIPLDGTSRAFNLPQTIAVLQNEQIGCVNANGDHSAALTSDGQLYVWGRAFDKRQNDYLPLKLAVEMKISQVALGWNHALLLTDEGELFILGGRLHGKLGALKQVKAEEASSNLKEETTTAYSVELVPDINRKRVMRIAAGAEHSALVTEDGAVMTWGWGEHGQLGLGNVLDHTVPQMVNLCNQGPNDPTKLKVYCGSGFTFVVKDII